MNYEQYAIAMNTHADTCEQCTFARKTGKTTGACEVAQAIIAEWVSSTKTNEDMFLASMNSLARELKDEGIDLEVGSDESHN